MANPYQLFALYPELTNSFPKNVPSVLAIYEDFSERFMGIEISSIKLNRLVVLSVRIPQKASELPKPADEAIS